MKPIILRVENPTEMRYKTIGDWYDTDAQQIIPQATNIEVADLGSDEENFLILLHELIEKHLCDKAGITQEQVDEYDEAHSDDDDPGLNSDAPYHSQHMVAYSVEVLIAGLLGVNWKEYTDKIDEVFETVAEAIDSRSEETDTEKEA